MSDMAIHLTPVTAVQEFGEIGQSDGHLVVQTRTGTYPARRALSCLIEPIPGDRVLVALDAPDSAFVLAVLERSAAVPSRIVFTGSTEIFAPCGSIELGARDGISIGSPQSIELVSNALQVSAVEAKFAVERASYAGAWLRACIDNIKLAASSLDAVIDRWSQRLRQSLRRVDELEQVHAGQIDYVAHETFALHGNNTMMTADHLVKVDAKQIHVG